jgi:NAD(P)-dependent dehydrogenase (short-subunit alcohol dehydrogenase family)
MSAVNEPWLTAVIVVPAVLVVFALFLVMWHERTSNQTARVAVISGIVLLAWLVGTGILALRGFYFPPVSGPPPVGVQLAAALMHFGEALHDELEPHGVVVTVLAPGALATAFVDVAHQRDTRALRLLTMQPRPVAAIGIEALLRGRSSVVAGVRNKLIAISNRFTPRRIQRSIFQRVFSGNGR